ALDDLRDPVDGHDLLHVGDTLVCAAAAIVTAFTPLATGAAPRCCSHQWFLFSWLILCVTKVIGSELQSALSCRLSERGDATGVPVAAAVEDDPGDAGLLGALRDELTHLDGLLGLGA